MSDLFQKVLCVSVDVTRDFQCLERTVKQVINCAFCIGWFGFSRLALDQN